MTQSKRLFAVALTGFTAMFAAHAACAQTTATPPAAAASASAPAMADKVFAAWDSDKSGSLSESEFKAGWNAMRQALELQEHLRAQFNTVDVDKSGYIDAKEYANLVLVKKAGASAPPFSTFDSNKNQRMDFVEYINFVKQMTAPKPASPAAK